MSDEKITYVAVKQEEFDIMMDLLKEMGTMLENIAIVETDNFEVSAGDRKDALEGSKKITHLLLLIKNSSQIL